MNSVLACFNWRTIVTPEDGYEEEKEIVEPLKAVYRDELTIKKAPPVPCKAPKKSVRFADEEEGEGEGIRVKVKMTKEEANRLLSKCKEGGLLDFKDVARELVNIPIHRVTVLSIPQQQ
ncbi:hypothetical protein HN51_068942 [Arachis hypogaea]|uniref:DUF7890 domain-containing protein n=1 Tax=Arachis hypogaea TaxID=3818 RepID=A0A444Z8H2_ARAHY|nr:uncharacterized protein DS421_15g495310 [Arachis hypogaea]RYR10408.1 hypothetical protein Ahy_B05g078862 [Arachis hypogaea]